MNYKISSEYVQVTVSSRGGEMQSIKKDSTEYLWQGDELIWPDKAINLFPYIARLTKGRYIYRGKEYQMEPHGFLPDSQLDVILHTDTELQLQLQSTEATRTKYPFSFTYQLHYRADKDKILIRYIVKNTDVKEMYFGIGGHPGFIVPLEEGLQFEDYMLDFGEPISPYRIGMSDNCFVTGEDEPYTLREDQYLDLQHQLFDNDAIILKGVNNRVALKSEKGIRGVEIEYPHMPYLGIWHWPKTEVDYICIEPWSSLPSREGVIEDIAKQDNLIRLPAGETYTNDWSIRIK